MPMSTAAKFEAAHVVYKRRIRTFSEKSFRMLPGFNRDDLEQEMFAVLWTCIEKYDPNRGAVFNTVFWHAAKNRLRDLLRRSNAKKRAAVWIDLDDEAVRLAVEEATQEFSAEDMAILRITLSDRIKEGNRGRRRRVA